MAQDQNTAEILTIIRFRELNSTAGNVNELEKLTANYQKKTWGKIHR